MIPFFLFFLAVASVAGMIDARNRDVYAEAIFLIDAITSHQENRGDD